MLSASASFSADESSFRNMVVTLEDTKIRHRKIEEREALRDIEAADWHARLKAVRARREKEGRGAHT